MQRSTIISRVPALKASFLKRPEGPRSGNDLKGLVDHARRMRTLMRYAPRKGWPAIIESLAPSASVESRISIAPGETGMRSLGLLNGLAQRISKPAGRAKLRRKAAIF